MTEKPKILIVDDKTENLYTLDRLLQTLNVEVIQAQSGPDALILTLVHEFCVAIVDIQMPGMDGYEMVALLRSNEGTATLPVIFVSAIYSDEYHHRKGYEAGAVDFLSKPFIPEILLSKVQVFIDLYRQRKALEEEVKQRRQAEAALHQANLTLSRLNADKDKFFSIIAHDLRSPFMPLLGNTEFLINEVENLEKSEIKDMLERVYRGGKTIYNLMESLLTWSRLQQKGGMQCSPEPIELKELADKTVAVLRPIADQKEIQFINSIAAGLWVEADRHMLETVIRNLTGNALKFTPRGGRVTLAGYVNGVDASPGFVRVSVHDTGIGMDQAHIASLFEINNHHTTLGTAQEKGSGLGLMICKEMVERNGGRIEIQSQVGQGTTVEFTVPSRPAVAP